MHPPRRTLIRALLALVTAALLPLTGSAVERSSLTRPSQSDRWLSPLGASFAVSTPFHLPNGEYRSGHRGIDIAAAAGEVVVSPTDGVVSFIGTVVDRPVVSITVDERIVLSLEPVTSELAEGSDIPRGAPLGTTASGGHCAATCLHLGVRVDGAYVNPLRYLRPRPILVPW